MNKAQIDKIEKEIRKVNHVFKKNKKIDSITRNVSTFMKGLSPEQSALLLVKLLVTTAPVLTRKKVHMLLKDSIDPNMGLDIDLLLEDLYPLEENSLKVRDLLKGN
jgi:hypothetical protein